MGRLIDADKFLERVKKDREHEIYLHSWTADMVLKRLDSWYAPTVEAIPKADYEARLKADMAAMLIELKNKLIDKSWNIDMYDDDLDFECCYLTDIDEIIQQKIDKLKSEQ